MQLNSLLVSFLLASFVAAEGQKHNSEKATCYKMRKLQKFVEVARNTTKLEELTNNNATRVAELQAQANTAATQLNTLQSNSTLVADCARILAAEELEDRCEDTFELSAFIAFAANKTLLAEKTHNNATKMAAIEAKAATAATRLQNLMSNSTLQAACPAILQRDECKAMNQLERFVRKAHNETLLNMVTQGNRTKADRIRKEAEMAQAELSQMQHNRTFMDACIAMGMVGNARGIDSSAATEESATIGNGAAPLIGNVPLTVLSTIVVVAAGMFLL